MTDIYKMFATITDPAALEAIDRCKMIGEFNDPWPKTYGYIFDVAGHEVRITLGVQIKQEDIKADLSEFSLDKQQAIWSLAQSLRDFLLLAEAA